jgi:hypothetical protein
MKTLNNSIKIFFICLRICIIVSPVVILFIAGWRDLVPSGQTTYRYDIGKSSAIISPLFPANRLQPELLHTNSGWQKVVKEPVYFEARLQRKFDQAEVTVEFANPSNTFVQVGLRTIGELDWNYDYLPLDNPVLNNLNWPKLSNGSLSLWQRQKDFQTIEQFTSVLPTVNNLAIYAYNLQRKFLLPDYQPLAKRQTIVRSLRGQHVFYTYIKNELLDFIFKYNDINRADGFDPWKIVVFDSENKEIYKMLVADDGRGGRFDGASKLLTAKLYLPNLNEGVYRIELQAEDEIIFRSFDTAQRYLTFANRLYLVDSEEYSNGLTDLKIEPTFVYSTISRLGFYTAHSTSLQKISIGARQTINLDKTHTDYYLTAKEVPTIIYSPKNDIKIFGRGLLALSKDTYFNPEIYNLRDFAATPDIKYLLTSYQVPQQTGEWRQNRVVFSLANANPANRKLRFSISAPELQPEKDNIYIKSISLTLKGEKLSLSDFFKGLLKYIKNKD